MDFVAAPAPPLLAFTAYSAGAFSLVIDPAPPELELQPVATLGPELVTNGDASSGAGWGAGDYWSVTGGKFVREGEPGDADNVTRTPNEPLTGGATVRHVFKLDAINGGSVRAVAFGAQGTPRTEPGTYTEDLVVVTPGAPVGVQASATNTSMTVDDISTKQVL